MPEAAQGTQVNVFDLLGSQRLLQRLARTYLGPDVDFGMFARMTGVLPGFSAPSDIAESIAYLASDAASSVTGASLVIDRGTLW